MIPSSSLVVNVVPVAFHCPSARPLQVTRAHIDHRDPRTALSELPDNLRRPPVLVLRLDPPDAHRPIPGPRRDKVV